MKVKGKKKQVIKLTEEQKQLVISHYDFIKKCVDCNVTYIPSEALWSREDAYQIGFLAACEAAIKYDPERASFATFVSKNIRGKLSLLFKETDALIKIYNLYIGYEDLVDVLENNRGVVLDAKGDMLEFYLSEIDDFVEKCIEDYKKEETTFELDFEIRNILSDPNAGRLTKKYVDVANRYLRGEKLTAIGLEYGVDREKAYIYKEKGLEILKKRISTNE